MNKRRLCAPAFAPAFALAAIALTVGQLAITSNICGAGPYAPAAGQRESTAIHMDDTRFVDWADGWEDYNVGTYVNAQWQTPEKALGKAAGSNFDIVSLGRGGEITLTFSTPIMDGPGWDFATFENSITDVFLELGYVEVSSNGTDFFRFENYSLTAIPVNGFGAVDPTDITGYCSKYRQGYGTPFDLSELVGVSELLDVNDVRYVKIVDIVGDGTYFDTSGSVIHEPYPTVGSAGVDLDAIGVIHAVPEPGTLLLLLTAVLTCGVYVARLRLAD